MSSRFDIIETPLAGIHVLRRKAVGDQRGCLDRMFCSADLESVIGGRSIAQVNRTHTAARGTVRGMHFQHPPHEVMKLVSCLRGEVFDVVVDMRPDSPTRFQWHAEILSPENHKTLAIPEGFAHGLQTLTEDCEMLYFHTAAFHPSAEGGLNPCDPQLAIEWPLPIIGLSERDRSHPFISAP